MVGRAPHSFRMRTALTAVIALAIWGVFTIVVPAAEFPAEGRLFGLPLRAALALPVGLPALVLAMFWFAARQNLDDERLRDDD